MTKTFLAPRYIEIDVPDDWKTKKLKDIVKKHNSGIFKNKDLYGTGSNIIGVVDLYDNISINGQTFGLVELTDEEKKGNILVEGDLIYAESSLVRDGIGKTLYVTKRGEGTVFAWHTRRFSLKEGFDPKFVYYQLNSNVIRNSIIARSTTTALTGITTKDYFGTKIPIPPTINEQRGIASKLLSIDELIQQANMIIKRTKLLKKGLVQKFLIEGIGHKEKPKKENWFFGKKIKIPKEWKIKKLIDLTENKKDIVAGPFGSDLLVSDYTPVGVPIIRLQNIERNKFISKNIKFISKEKAKELSYHSYQPNDIVLAKLGDPIGKTCIIPKSVPAGIVVADVVRIRISPKKSNPKYIEYVLNSAISTQQYYRDIIGSTRPRVNLNHIRNLRIPCPQVGEQQKIVYILSNVDIQTQTQEQYKRKLERLKKGLMQKLLTGQVRVKV